MVVYKYANLLDRNDWFGLLFPLLIVVGSLFFPPAGLIILFVNHGKVAGVSVETCIANVGGITEEKVDLQQSLKYLESGVFSTAVRQAMEDRDQADRDEWVRQGRPGAGQSHRCKICGKTIYGEETVIDMQKQAIYGHTGGPFAAQQWEKISGYRCKSCGSEYCKGCLEEKAPINIPGGKSCPSCSGLFEVIHG